MLSPKLEWPIANPLWSATLNPLITNPLNQVQIIPNISLINGITVINHKLGKTMNGWFITDIQGAATIYRSAPFNPITLSLTSNAIVVVTLGVF